VQKCRIKIDGVDRVFLLSPANAAGKRAQMLINPRATFELARRLRNGESISLGEAFTFASSLYFRGKLAYARAFASAANIFVMTSNRGLLRADLPITSDELRALGDASIDLKDERYRKSLLASATQLAEACEGDCEIVLLGSIASGKYVDLLLPVFGERLVFPEEFVGRGDMSRGGLLLRCVEENRLLHHMPVAGAVRNGARPPKLPGLRSR
jgi:hypothetical protein